MRRYHRRITILGVAAAMALGGTLAPASAREPEEGVRVGNPSFVRKLVPAERLEKTAAQQYLALKRQASSRHALMPRNHPQYIRLHRIARDLLPFVPKWHPRAKSWKWEIVLINSGNINAFCMPGGKIAVFTGIIEKLKLTDDEIAMIVGHEIAHALREHSRERAAKTTITNVGGRIIGALIFGQAGEALGAGGASLLTLKFSRDDEKEADLIGMELAARAGYNPASGITLWQKMSQAAKGGPPQWLSTHPASDARVKLIRDNLKYVEGLYERARAKRATRDAAAPQVPPATPGR